jgi:integrase
LPTNFYDTTSHEVRFVTLCHPKSRLFLTDTQPMNSAISDEFHDPGQPNLQIALDDALRAGAIPANRVAGIRAAVAAFARLMKRSADQLPAHQGFVIQQLRRLRRGPTGLALKTLSNTRCNLLYLIKAACGRGPRSVLPLSEDWAQFRRALGHGPAWWSLSRLGGFSSRKGTSPSDVGDAHIKKFAAALWLSSEVADPDGHARRVIRIWSKVAVAYPALRLQPLTLPPQKRRRWTLSETAFPQSFCTDVEAWFQRLTSNDPFSPRPLRPLRPSTIRTRKHQLYKAASALVLSGHPIERIRSLADLVTVEAFQSLLRHLLERQGRKATEALHGLAGGLLAVARHHVEVDAKTDAQLARVVKNLDVGAMGFRSRTRTRLMEFEDDRRVAALLQLPARLLAEAKAANRARRRQQLAEMAIAIETLIFAPMRIANLTSIRLGVTLRRVALGRKRRWVISIPADQVKNRTELSYELPNDSHDLIEKALALYGQPDGWLFPGRKSGPKAASLLSGQIKRTVESRVGVAFHTHMFRALAGYLHLRENPNGFEAVRAILGNRDDNVVRNNYAFLAERSLIANAQASIDKTRARLVPPSKDERKDV